MNFSDFGKYNQFKEQFANMSPEMKEQMMKMAKEQMKARVGGFFKKWFSLPVLTIVAAGMGAAIGALMAFFGQVLQTVGGLRDAHPIYFIPGLALAGIAIVLAYKKWGKGAERGMGLIFSVGQGKESHIPLRLIPMVAVGTWLTHLFGGSAGREGVAVQIGGALGHNISKKLPFENASHIMLVAGMAAGFSGLFQIPMAATAFALEVLIVGHMDLMALLPAAVAAFTACKVSNMLGLEKFAVDLNGILSTDGGATVSGLFMNGGALDMNFVAKLALLGVLFGVIGGGFAKLLSLAKEFFAKKFPDGMKRIAIMGVTLSALFLLLWQGRYSGLGTNLIDMCFSGAGIADGSNIAGGIQSYDWILKFALTILTLAAGFQGGEVTPLFSIGASLGAVSAVMFGLPFPLAAALGYAAVFGSATNTLWAPILIGCEVFGFDCLPAFFVVCIAAYVCNGGQSIYNQKKLKLKF
ncbi:MAG: chloride channel protein [Fibrobacter sp.]|nr:chloride channel protein [Fibrobacter sp.]